MGGMAGVGVAPPPNQPPTSLSGGSTRARHPGPSIARARCGGKRYPGCLSVPLPSTSPDPPPLDNPLQTAPSLIARYDDARESPLTRARCGGGSARSLNRVRGVWRLRWRWRAVTSPVTRVTRAARHARVCVRRHRASCASSPFPSPPCTTGTRALQRRRRSLARSIAPEPETRTRTRIRTRCRARTRCRTRNPYPVTRI